MRRILITRPIEDATETARHLAVYGIDTVIAPLFTLHYLSPSIPSQDYQAVIFTSRHSARNFIRHYDIPAIPAFCVGDETAISLGNAPFSAIHSADADAVALHQLINRELPDKTRPLLRLHADLPNDPLYDWLREDGFDITRIPFYQTNPVPTFPQTVISAIQQGHINEICLYSPNAARHFIKLITQENLSKACGSITAWCISDNTRDALHPVPFRRIFIAPHPSHQAMINMISNHHEQTR